MRRSLDEFRELTIRQLTNRVFTYDSSPADERWFRQRLYELMIGKCELGDSFRQFCWLMIYERNDNGKSCKYLHWNEHTQRLSLAWEFQAWAEKVCDEIEARVSALVE